MTDLSFMPMRKGPPKLSDAVDRITLNTVAHEMRDPLDIGDTLSMLAQTGEAVTVYPPGRELVMARIAAVDAERRTFTLDLLEDSLLDEGRACLVASLGGNAKVSSNSTPTGPSCPAPATWSSCRCRRLAWC